MEERFKISQEGGYFELIFSPYELTKVWKPPPNVGKVWFTLSRHHIHQFIPGLLQLRILLISDLFVCILLLRTGS